MSHFRLFHTWLFDGKSDSPIPKDETFDLLKYNSPITHTYLLSMFMTHGGLNKYLNTHMNNINLRYLEREDLFYFMKTCVRDFKIKRRDMLFIPYRQKDATFKKLRPRLPMLKNYDIDLLCDLINKSDDKDSILSSLGIDKVIKKKLKKKSKQKKKMGLKEFLIENFATVEIKI